jgi:HEAT repeats
MSNIDPQSSIIQFLCAELSYQPSLVRAQIVAQLGDIANEAAVPTLMDAIQRDPDMVVRKLAVKALGNIYQKIAEQQTRNESIAELQQIIASFSTKYPDLNNANIADVIDAEFTTIQNNDPQKWQKLKDVLSVIFAGGTEAVKIVIPVAGIPIEVSKKLYEIWKNNRTS